MAKIVTSSTLRQLRAKTAHEERMAKRAAAAAKRKHDVWLRKLRPVLRRISCEAQEGRTLIALSKSEASFTHYLEEIGYLCKRPDNSSSSVKTGFGTIAMWASNPANARGSKREAAIEAPTVFHAAVSEYFCSTEGQALSNDVNHLLEPFVFSGKDSVVLVVEATSSSSTSKVSTWKFTNPDGVAFNSFMPPERVAEMLEARGFSVQWSLENERKMRISFSG